MSSPKKTVPVKKNANKKAAPNYADSTKNHPILSTLSAFVKKNPQAELSVQDNNIVIDKLFGYSDSQFLFPLSNGQIIDDLNNLEFRQQYDALIHTDSNEVEFIFAYLNPKSPTTKDYIDRKFEFTFEGAVYEAVYEAPSERLLRIAAGFVQIPNIAGVQAGYQLAEFRDAQRIKELPPRVINYFAERSPRSFKLKAKSSLSKINLESLARHLNFVSTYYDRDSPTIVIRQKVVLGEVDKPTPARYLTGHFPTVIDSGNYDGVAMKLLEVARNSEPRLAFLYCYQVFEYAGFHYIDAKAKNEIMKILGDPAIRSCLDQRLGELFGTLSDTVQNDDIRMQRVIEQTCDPAVLWKEINMNRDFFSNASQYNGGFSQDALVSKDMTLDGWASTWTPKLHIHLTRIRNCLVHARERRENKVILPDKENDDKIAFYIPLIRRMAEQVTICGGHF